MTDKNIHPTANQNDSTDSATAQPTEQPKVRPGLKVRTRLKAGFSDGSGENDLVPGNHGLSLHHEL